jgi:hypothetical protein
MRSIMRKAAFGAQPPAYAAAVLASFSMLGL